MGTEKQEKHMVRIILFISEGHEAIWGTLSTVVFSGLKTFCSVP
jgi:hypothetical protein